jgi:hypothetical protein
MRETTDERFGFRRASGLDLRYSAARCRRRSQVIEQASNAACRAHDGIGEVREVIRAQPITAALVVFALGYLFGRLGALIPSGSRRA